MFDKFKKNIFSKGSQSVSPVKIGDSVKVKEGISDPDDMDYSIAGWQGWVVEVFDADVNESNKDTLQFMVAWDSITLRNIARERLIELEIEGYDWTIMCLDMSDVEIATPRDKMEDAESVIEELSDSIYWEGMGKEGVLIANIIVDANTIQAAYQAWATYFQKTLSFPFSTGYFAKDDEVIPNDEIVEVQRLDGIDSQLGVMVKVKYDNGLHRIAINDLIFEDLTIANNVVLDLYNTWFVNKKEDE